MKIGDVLCMRFNVEYMKYTTTASRKEITLCNDRFKKEIPAMKFVDFEHCHFPMETDDDEHNEI